MRKANRLKMAVHEEHVEGETASERGKPLVAFLIILILAGVVAWFWLARDPDSRRKLTESMDRVGSAVQHVVSFASRETGKNTASGGEPPKAGVPSRTPVSSLSAPVPSAVEQTPPGVTEEIGAVQNGRGPVFSLGDSEDTRAEAGNAPDPGTSVPGGAAQRGALVGLEETVASPAVGRQDDAVVRVLFIEDLAKWLVAGYQPSAGGKGRLSVNLQAANLRYGVGMRGLSWIGDDLPKGRVEALDYVFTPDMLSALYKLYIERFMAAMEQAGEAPAANGKRLTAEQRADMYNLYARRFRGLSGSLQGVASLPDLTQRMDALHEAVRRVVAVNAAYSDAVFAFDAAREQGDTARAAALRRQVDAAGQRYREAVVERERTAAALARAIRHNAAARALDDDTLLYVASWVDRRVRQKPQAVEAAFQAATLFLELAQRFEQASGRTSR